MSAVNSSSQRGKYPIQYAAVGVGAVFLVVGILGFIPGVTTGYDGMTFAGHESTAMLLGIFHISILHNIVHLIFGVAGLLLGRSLPGSRYYLVGGGIVYLVLWIYGLVVDLESGANFVPLNTADNWLHLFLGIGMIALGIVLWRMSSDDSAGRSRAAEDRPGGFANP